MTDGPKSPRIYSLDVFRGATIAGMILVNNPGSWEAIYGPLQHAPWHGLTPTDLIFPFFLFIVGVSISIALGKRAESADKKDVYKKIVRRFLVIFVFGLFLNAFPFFDLEHLRIPGVLQRIAVCYLVASLIFLHTGWKQQGAVAVGLLILYWASLYIFQVPGCDVTTIDDKACNVAAYLDRLILGESHIWSLGKVYDPEGILSTVPAIATTLSGVLTGTWLRSVRGEYEKAAGMFFAGSILLVLGWIWSFWFPLNKSLWTSSYVLYTSGLALSFLGCCYWICDIKDFKKWAKPFEILGVNAIFLYMGAELLARTLTSINASGTGPDGTTLKEAIYAHLFEPFFAPANASLLFALTFVLLWLGALAILYRKKIFIKI
ncbi:MAG TPA: heparan-alpha-glucosaminide N-acetyltransferase domain-containing protein [Aridibacter sp.]|nr:heparan-alpha-glucosaminide N-acetyltransferase domain-containing protein [Aridibacter sp.]